MKICALILTYNEKLHIERCIRSLDGVVDNILVVDSFSTDETTNILRRLNVDYVQREFFSHSDQINAGIELLQEYDWVFRIDADEYVEAFDKNDLLSNVGHQGLYVKRKIVFLGDHVKFGGVSGKYVLRVFDPKYAQSEAVLMDERILITGSEAKSKIVIIDNNLNNLDWWFKKHLFYSKRQAIDITCTPSKYKSISKKFFIFRSLVRIYQSLGLKAKLISYLFYRLIIMRGIFDRRNAFLYHILQGITYRAMVEARILESKYDSGNQD